MSDLSAGTKVAGKYTLIGRVGRGGMGDVWIARNEATHAEVAIKTLRPDRRSFEQAEERFRHEARVSAKIRHPNVARVYDLAEAEDGSLLLVMERLHGTTLRARLAEGKVAVEEIVEISLSILDALAASHAAGVIHRDVTPGNIFLAEEGGRIVPKLIDFGVAKTQDQIITTKTGHAIGTPQYMSPEQIRCKDLDGRADLFSLSVTMFEAITGANPFKRNAASGSLAAVLEVDVDPDPTIPSKLWLVLARNLSKQSYERHASAAEMASAVRVAMNGEAAVPDPPRTTEPSIVSSEIQLRPKKRAAFLWLIAAALVLVVALVFARARRDSQPASLPPAQPPNQATPAVSVTTPRSPVFEEPVIKGSPPAALPAAVTTSRATSVPVKTTKPRPSAKPVATTPGF